MTEDAYVVIGEKKLRDAIYKAVMYGRSNPNIQSQTLIGYTHGVMAGIYIDRIEPPDWSDEMMLEVHYAGACYLGEGKYKPMASTCEGQWLTIGEPHD